MQRCHTSLQPIIVTWSCSHKEQKTLAKIGMGQRRNEKVGKRGNGKMGKWIWEWATGTGTVAKDRPAKPAIVWAVHKLIISITIKACGCEYVEL